MSWWQHRFYVYILVDPRDGEAFYVGKGQRKRIDAHEREARHGIRSRKCDRIREIWACGLEVKKEKIARFHDEESAYVAEIEVIEAIGLNNLTNVLPGGGTAWEERCRAEDAIEEATYSIETLKGVAPGLKHALFQFAKHRNFHVYGIDMTEWLLWFSRKLIQDCGVEAFSREIGLGQLLVGR